MQAFKAALGAALLAGAMAAGAPTASAAPQKGSESPAGPPMLQTTNRKLGPVAQARREVADARSDAGRYRLVMTRKRQKLEYALQARPDYREAVVARNKAKAACEQAARPALLAARASDEHKAAKAQWLSSSAMASAAMTGGAGALSELRSIREDLTKYATALKEMEDKAVSADPRAAEARAALDAAEAKLLALRTEHVDDVLEADPQYTSAASQLESAQARLDTATANLAKVSQDSKDAKEAARMAYLAEQEALRQARLAAPS